MKLASTDGFSGDAWLDTDIETATAQAEDGRSAWQPREVPERSGFGQNQGRAGRVWLGARRVAGQWPRRCTDAVTVRNRGGREMEMVVMAVL